MNIDESIFKAYDIRGIYPSQLNEDLVYKIAQAYAKFINPKTVALGRDVRTSGESLFEAAKKGLADHGVNVVDIGVISTDMLYFAVANYGYDGGITISASHNPKEYNGMKMVREQAKPISGDTGIMDLKQLVKGGYAFTAAVTGTVEKKDIRQDYIHKCLSFVDTSRIKPMKVLANAMFGPAFESVKLMNLPVTLIPLNEVPDGNFPKGQPDPMQEQNRLETIHAVKHHNADLGVAWDADADRCFIFDETGRFIPGYYLTAFLGEYLCRQVPGSKIIHDPRLVWAIQDKVSSQAGQTVVCKAGHSFFKEKMRAENAIFAGESSGHFYFRDFFYADNGLIPFLLMLQIVSQQNQKLSKLFDSYFEKYPISGEINIKLSSTDLVKGILAKLEDTFSDAKIDKIDGLSIEYETWRANIRGSNTEPLIRLNLEARDQETLDREVTEVQSLIS